MRARWPAATASARRTSPDRPHGDAARRSIPLFSRRLPRSSASTRSLRDSSSSPSTACSLRSTASPSTSAPSIRWARAARRLPPGPGRFYPFAIYFSAGRVWEYALTGLLFTTCFCIAQRIHAQRSPLAWLGWGALYGVTALSNPCVLSTFPFLLGLALYQAHAAGTPLVHAKGRAHRSCRARRASPPGQCAITASWASSARFATTSGSNIYADNFGNASPDQSRRSNALRASASNPAEMKKFLALGESLPGSREAFSGRSPEFGSHPRFLACAIRPCAAWSITGPATGASPSEELAIEPNEPANIFYVCCVTLLHAPGMRAFLAMEPCRAHALSGADRLLPAHLLHLAIRSWITASPLSRPSWSLPSPARSRGSISERPASKTRTTRNRQALGVKI